jgi:transposase
MPRRDFTRDYLHLVEHYGLEPQTTHTESPNENADVESANGALKRALKQELLLRGSRNFADLEGYEQFLFG